MRFIYSIILTFIVALALIGVERQQHQVNADVPSGKFSGLFSRTLEIIHV
jgi:hypothetical protein